jgi:hypothetical protein
MTNMTFRLRFLPVAALLAGTVLLAGCGGPDRVSKTTTTEQSTSMTPMPPPPPVSSSSSTTTTIQTRP